MDKPSATLSDDGERLRLVHGPIDLIIGAEGRTNAARQQAFSTATNRFETILPELAEELPLLRTQCPPDGLGLRSPVAKRMESAVRPHARNGFVTPMAAVAGAVAEEILAAMLDRTALSRAYVNNGGDIALHLSGATTYAIEMAAFGGKSLGTITLTAASGVGGIATSGRHGRSLSMGIADAVTVLANSAADADVAATLIANAVDLPGHPGVSRKPASELQPDSDLGDRLVVVGCEGLSQADIAQALDRGLICAESMISGGLIASAALFLAGHHRMAGAGRLDDKGPT